MRIGIDIAQLNDRHLTGISLYIESIVRELLHIRGDEETFVLVGNQQGNIFNDLLRERGVIPPSSGGRQPQVLPGWDLRLGANFAAVDASPLLSPLTRRLDGRLLQPLSQKLTNTSLGLSGPPLDVFHHTSRIRIAPNRARRHIATIYDLTTRFFPDVHHAGNIAVWERIFAFARDKADLVITDSESARHDVMEHLGIPGERVRAIPLAVRATLPRQLPPGAVQAARQKWGLHDDPFVLSVCSLDERKNLPRLVEAFAEVAGEPNAGNTRLVLTGSHGSATSAIRQTLEARGLQSAVVMTGYASDANVAALMAGCACFAYPSLYEGFGMPILEAMTLGAPVVTSTTSSLPEVAGDAALLVDPRDVAAIASALRRVLCDPALADDLRKRGRARAATFSWERSAREHLRAYRDVAGA